MSFELFVSKTGCTTTVVDECNTLRRKRSMLHMLVCLGTLLHKLLAMNPSGYYVCTFFMGEKLTRICSMQAVVIN